MNSGFEEEFERRWNWDWNRHGVGYWVELESTWGRVLGGVGSKNAVVWRRLCMWP